MRPYVRGVDVRRETPDRKDHTILNFMPSFSLVIVPPTVLFLSRSDVMQSGFLPFLPVNPYNISMFGKTKTSLSVWIFLLQIALVGCIIVDLIPRELYVLWALFLVGYFLWEKLDRALLFFMASLPLFMAMPLAPALDTINIWRILVIIIFLKWAYIKVKSQNLKLKTITQNLKLHILTGLLLVLVLVSIFLNDAPIIGIKRLIFFLNIFALVPVVKHLMRQEGFLARLARAVGVSLALILFVGYLQLAAIFVVPIDQFIGWWAHHVTKTYYGGRLNEYILLDNNWFTYEPGSAPTLRMFSIFHESHALGLYTILALPFIGYLWKVKSQKSIFVPSSSRGKVKSSTQNSKLLEETIDSSGGRVDSVRRLLFSRPFLIVLTLPLLAVVLTGTRGLWISAVGAIGFWFFLWLTVSRVEPSTSSSVEVLRRAKSLTAELRFFSAILVLLAILFFVGSLIGFLEQKAQSLSRGGEDIGVALNRLKSAFDLEETSNQGRLGIWKQALPAVLDHPFFGVGLGNFGAIMGNEGDLRFSAHNLYLHFAAELGIPALIVIMAAFGLIFHRALQAPAPSRAYALFFLFSFSWLLVANIFDVTLLDQRVLLLFAVSIAALDPVRPLVK